MVCNQMRILFSGLILCLFSVHVFAQGAETSFCSQQSTNEVVDLTVSESIRARQNTALEWFSPPEGEGYVSPERLEKGFAELEAFRAYCADNCNAYEKLSMYMEIGQIYFDLQRYDNVFAAYHQAINTAVRIPINYEKTMLVNSANIYFERGEFPMLGPCLSRLNELSLFNLMNHGHLMSAWQLASGQHERALEFINTLIKYREDSSSFGIARSKDYQTKKKILEAMEREVDRELLSRLDSAIAQEKLPAIFNLASPKIPNAVAKGKVEGSCTLEFDVLANGKTDNVRAVDCKHKDLEKVSIEAIEESVYRPRIVNGAPTKTPGMRHTFSFSRRGASSL